MPKGNLCAIGRSIDNLLMTPVIHFQYGVVQRETLHPVFQLIKENHAAFIQILIVDSYRQYEMAEDILWDAIAPSISFRAWKEERMFFK